MSSQWQTTARLVRRTGFGATGSDIDAVLREGAARYVARVVAADPQNDPGARATPPPAFDALPKLSKKLSEQERKERNKAIQEQSARLTTWWLRRMATVHEPFGEKLTFCWHNHFATSIHKVRSAWLMWQQNDRLRTLGTGEFRKLAYTMLTDGATLRFLDGEDNTAKAPNENLAREFMEIFTLGHNDGYTEEDVRQGARALTGWKVAPNGTTAVRPRLHDNGSKTFLGVTGDLDAAGYCDAVLARPGSPGYIATRMWGQLVSNTPPAPDVLDRLVAAYGPRRDLGAMFRAMLTDPAFAAAEGSYVIGPVEWLIGAVRALRAPMTRDADVVKVGHVVNSLGQLPFYPPSVGGWSVGQAWLSTAAAEIRLRAATALAAKADLSALDGSAPSRLDSVAHLLGIESWSARSAAVLRTAAGNPHRLVAIALNTPEYLVH